MSTPRPHEKWCKSMPREFDAAMGRGPYECDCRSEGVAAPLEPTTTCLQAIADYISGFQLVDKSGDPDAEMIRIHNSAIAVAVGQILDMHDNMQVVQSLNEFAAAVSKNLQQSNTKIERERDAAVVTLRAMCGDEHWQTMSRNFAKSLAQIEARESRVLELEKEIAAQGETR
jgi:hypothetical protein